MWMMVVRQGMGIVFLSVHVNLYSHNHAILAEILLQFHFKGPIKRTSTKGDSWRSSSLESLESRGLTVVRLQELDVRKNIEGVLELIKGTARQLEEQC